jgi:peptidoglycan/LPS O-acetylase OafA/YrhL
MTKPILTPAARVRGLAETPAAGGSARDVALDLARAAVTLLVVAHHAVLAYHRYAPPAGPFNRENLIWAAFPVVDAARAPVIDAFTLWNDSFFMALMFLLAGLFVPTSLARKGAGRFLRDRAMRLGGAFVLSAAVLAPLAYYPAYLLRAGGAGSMAGFWDGWLALGIWPAGPAWFLWVLLAFSGLAASLQVWVPGALARLSALGDWCRVGPVRACAVLGALALVAYLPVLHWVNPSSWAAWGPFTVQSSRVGLYAVYFFFGYALAAGGRAIPGEWMNRAGVLASRWQAWQGVAGGVFVVFVAALIWWLTRMGQGRAAVWLDVVVTVLFVATGAATSFALLATLARWGHWTGRWAASLTRNAFGIYLVHYPVVVWLQFALLGAGLPGWAKALLVTAAGIGASWVLAAALRRLPLWLWLEPGGK